MFFWTLVPHLEYKADKCVAEKDNEGIDFFLVSFKILLLIRHYEASRKDNQEQILSQR
jgi:hypothetical protein